MPDEACCVEFHTKVFTSWDKLQTDLDAGIELYNNKLVHSGRYCYGKTPMQIFLDSRKLAQEKILERLHQIDKRTVA